MNSPPPPTVLYLPETYLFLTNDSLYPAPTSWNSTPDSVVPSQLNWAAMVPWLPGPLDSSKRARSEPTPPSTVWDREGKCQRARLL